MPIVALPRTGAARPDAVRLDGALYDAVESLHKKGVEWFGKGGYRCFGGDALRGDSDSACVARRREGDNGGKKPQNVLRLLGGHVGLLRDEAVAGDVAEASVGDPDVWRAGPMMSIVLERLRNAGIVPGRPSRFIWGIYLTRLPARGIGPVLLSPAQLG